jgi:MATE family multidrug resistance protein
MVVHRTSNAADLEGGSEEERLKREVAHGVRRTPAERPENDSFARAPMTREVFALAWPIAAAMLGETAMRLVDTKLVGGLGSAALGGAGLATVLMYLGYALSSGTMRGVNVRVAHAIGEGRPRDGFAFARAGLVISASFGFVVLLVCRDVTPLLTLLRANAEIVPYARDFLAAVTLGAPATCTLVALNQHSQAIGDSRTPMVIGITGNLFNALFAWTLIYGHFGLPALGVRGAGYATATTEYVEVAVMFAIFLRKESRAIAAGPASYERVPLRQALREVLDLGVPSGVQWAAETLAFTLFTVVLGTISKEQIAAHQISLNVMRVSFLPGIAVSEATTVLVGRALGARRPAEADAVVRSALQIGVGFMAACGVVFALGGGLLARFFSPDPAVVAAARTLLLVAAIFQMLDAVNIVMRGALRGAKDVRAVMVIGVLIVWSFLPTSAYLLGKVVGLGALGGWLGFVGETAFASALFWWRWKRGSWRSLYARPVIRT